MKLLRRTLYYQAALWTTCGLAIAVAPRWVLVGVFAQVPYPDYGYVRVCGAMSVGLALVMVLVAQRIEDVWWWSWAFALTDAAVVTITALNALFGRPEGSGALLWWLFAALNAALLSGILIGMAETGHEKPIT